MIATDTETQDGYAILITKPWSYAEPRNFQDCIEFLSTDRELICWNADYDVQAVLKWLPRETRDRIALLHETNCHGYRIRYIPHKFCRVWYHEKHLLTVYDLRQFYNCSLARAAELLGVPAKKKIPQSWYSQMAVRLKDPRTRSRVIDYALQDAQTLQFIVNKTIESFKLAGLKFEKPFSNASFAERYFRRKFRYKRNITVEKQAQQAYFGGRMECLQAGFFPRAYHYDIHSAYPSIIANLVKPDGEWIHETKPETVRADAIYAFVDCKFTIPQTVSIGPIPIRRRRGSLFYPCGTFRRILNLSEFKFMESKGWINHIFSCWQHIWPSWNYPFRRIADIYKRRKEDERVDYAFKIVMNSVYGKLAQVLESWIRTNRVDTHSDIFDERVWKRAVSWKDHTSFVYASEITSRIRIKLLEDIPPETVILYATDGVFTTCEIPLPTGNGLGQWSDVEEVRNLTVVGSGVYSYQRFPFNDKGKVKVKFRGFEPKMDLPGLLRKAGRRHFIPLKVLRNTSLKMGTRGRDYSAEMNILRNQTRYLNVNFDTKRKWSKRWNAGELVEQSFTSKPWIYWGVLKVPR